MDRSPSLSELERLNGELRRMHLDEQRALIESAFDDFFLYDEVLETALMLGVVALPGSC